MTFKKAEGRRQKAEDRRQKAEGRRQKGIRDKRESEKVAKAQRHRGIRHKREREKGESRNVPMHVPICKRKNLNRDFPD